MGGDAEEALGRYISGPDKLEAALAGLSESDLDLSRALGEWTIRQIVHHLVDGDAMWSQCIRMALGASGCTFDLSWYPGNDPWASELDYAGRAIEPAVALFRAQRSCIAQLLERFPDSWQHHVVLVATWVPQGQQMRVDALVNLLTEHVAEHVEEIQRVREQHGL
jgi:uncharacterized damage-inducible protein DinB